MLIKEHVVFYREKAMQLTRAFAYAVSGHFYVIITLLLLRSSLQIKRHTRQHYWFNVSLIVQATYLFLDGTRTLMMNRIVLGLPIAISMRGDREPEPVRLPQGDRLPVPAGLPSMQPDELLSLIHI